MKRRSLLRAAGLAAIVDVEGVAAQHAATEGDGEGPTADDEQGRSATDEQGPTATEVLERLAPLATTPGSLVAVARGPAVDPPEALQREVTAGGGVLTADVAATVWYGPDPFGVLAGLRERDFNTADDVAGAPAVIRRGRGRVRLVVAEGDVTVVGRGADRRTVAAQLATLLEAKEGGQEAPLVMVLENLGDGVAAVVQRPSAELGLSDGGPRPVLSGERVALRSRDVAIRRVAVYPSREASLAARERDWGPWPVDGPVERDGVTRTGRTVVRDATAESPAAVLDADD